MSWGFDGEAVAVTKESTDDKGDVDAIGSKSGGIVVVCACNYGAYVIGKGIGNGEKGLAFVMFETETLKMAINFEVEKKVNRISYRISFYTLT